MIHQPRQTETPEIRLIELVVMTVDDSNPHTMKRRQFLISSTLGLIPACHQTRCLGATAEPVEAAIKLIQTEVAAGKVESAVLQVQRGSSITTRAFGRANSADAIFLIASITKPMTATGIMILADRGELKLSDPVRKFIPEFSAGERKNITVLNLLNHTSGLPDQVPLNASLRQRHAPLSEFVKAAVATPLLFRPGTRYSYQSMGFLLASEIAQRITGTPFPDFLGKELFAPLGMKRTALGMGGFKIAETVRCQTESAAPESGAGAAAARRWDWNSPYWRNLGAPWGGAHSTTGDISRFLRSFLHPDGRVLREATARSMIHNHTKGLSVPRGLGFDLSPGSFGKFCSRKTFGHRGATGTLCWTDPERDQTCVILTSLPIRTSGELLLRPVADLVSSRP
jgi:CubicO group peptidase (beta-lactamase class C family)